MKKLLTPFLSLVILSAVMTGGCSSPAGQSAAAAAIRAYADPAAQTTMEGLSENNLGKYTQYGDAQFKAAVTQAVFDQVYGQINSQLGTLVSITFSSTENQSPYIIVHYKAKYSKGDAGIRMVFDQDHLVAGQFFE